MATETPMQTLKKTYGDKDTLISSIVGVMKHEGESDSDASKRLRGVSNSKLLRMGRVAKAIGDFGGREKVVSLLGEALGRSKDKDYLTKLAKHSNGTLVDMLQVAQKRARK